MKTGLWWRAFVMAVTTTILAAIVASPASAAKPVPPSCSIQVTGDGTDSVTFDATFVGVPKHGTTQLTVDNGVVADPFTTTEVGTHEASCQVLDRQGREVYRSSTVTATRPAPTYECALRVTDFTAFTVQVDWSVTVTNPDGTVFDVRVWEVAFDFIEEVASDATNSVSGTTFLFTGGLPTQVQLAAFENDSEVRYCYARPT
jgi:hypothetical protein